MTQSACCASRRKNSYGRKFGSASGTDRYVCSLLAIMVDRKQSMRIPLLPVLVARPTYCFNLIKIEGREGTHHEGKK